MRSSYIIDGLPLPAPEGRIRGKVKPARGDRIDYLYAEGEILVREEYLGQVLGILEPEPRSATRCGPPGRLRP